MGSSKFLNYKICSHVINNYSRNTYLSIPAVFPMNVSNASYTWLTFPLSRSNDYFRWNSL